MFTTQPHALRKATGLTGDLACERAEVVITGLPMLGWTSGRSYPNP
jgi:hypothetical protein